MAVYRDPAADKGDAENPVEARRRRRRQLDLLEQEIRRLHVSWQRFLAGDLKVPPLEAQDRARDMVRRLRGEAHGVAETFRLSTLEARLSSTIGNFARQLRRREVAGPAAKPPGAETAYDPQRGVTFRSGASSERGEEQLYQALGPAVDLEKFRAHLRRNAEAIRAKTGCQEIRFRIAVVDGKKKLKAKPIRTAS